MVEVTWLERVEERVASGPAFSGGKSVLAVLGKLTRERGVKVSLPPLAEGIAVERLEGDSPASRFPNRDCSSTVAGDSTGEAEDKSSMLVLSLPPFSVVDVAMVRSLGGERIASGLPLSAEDLISAVLDISTE